MAVRDKPPVPSSPTQPVNCGAAKCNSTFSFGGEGGLVVLSDAASCLAGELTYRDRAARNATVRSGRDTRTKSVIPRQRDDHNLLTVGPSLAVTTFDAEKTEVRPLR